MTLTNKQLICKAKELGFAIVIVMSTDLMDLRFYKNVNIIINLDEPESSGSHWTSLIIRDGNQCLYFDSFGVSPDNYVMAYCKSYNLKLCCNSYIVQDINTSSCGYYCLAFIKYMTFERPSKLVKWVYKNKWIENFNSFINMFEPEVELNEGILMKYLKDTD